MMVTEQEFFDKTIRHFVTQGHPATDDQRCKYRNDKGETCAVGCHIPKTIYRKRMDSGFGIYNLIREWPHLRKYIPSINLASDLQSIHDDKFVWFPDTMRQVLTDLADNYMLDKTVLNSLDFSKITYCGPV